jgi:integrase/recombinase XerD
MEEQAQLKDYLQRHHTETTTYGYYRFILIYLREHPEAKKYSYKEIVNYIGVLRNHYNKANTVKARLNAIKKYYEYLVATGQRKDNPCRNLNIKDKLHKDVQLQDLLTEKNLESLLEYQSKRFKSVLETRDRSMLSLLIYQGITKGEIKRLDISDLNLEAGSIYIKSSATSNSRTLELKSRQVLLLYKYMNEARPELLKNNPLQTDTGSLFISTKGKAETGDCLKHIFREIQKRQGIKVTISLIRQSVIAIKLKKGNDIRMVQSFAGHKNASSTERYKSTDIEELKAGVNKYHPLR